MILASRRAFLLALVGLALVPAGGLYGLLGLAWVGLLAAATLADGLLLPGRGKFSVERLVSEKLPLGEESPVTLELHNRTRLPLQAVVTDSPPLAFEAEGARVALAAGPRGRGRGSYAVLPPHRGNYRFEELYVRLQGPLGLGLRHFRLAAPAEVKVYPAYGDMHRFEALQHRFQLLQLGLRQMRLPGQGTDFEQLREYSQDDDVRWIDWNATARMHRPVSRAYQAERNQTLFLALDAGRLMSSRAGERLTRLDHCLNAAVMVAHVALRQGDRVGAMSFADKVLSFVPARGGAAHRGRLMDALYDVRARRTESNFERAISHLRVNQRRRALVVLFTDIQDLPTARRLVTHVASLRPVHLPLVLTIHDRDVRRLAAGTPESEEDLYRAGVAAELLLDRQQVLAELSALGAVVVDCPAQELAMRAVQKYLDLKLRNRI